MHKCRYSKSSWGQVKMSKQLFAWRSLNTDKRRGTSLKLNHQDFSGGFRAETSPQKEAPLCCLCHRGAPHVVFLNQHLLPYLSTSHQTQLQTTDWFWLSNEHNRQKVQFN